MRKRLIEPPLQGTLDLVEVTVVDGYREGLTDWLTEEPARPGWYDLRGGPPFPDPGHVERAFFNGRVWYCDSPGGTGLLGDHQHVVANGFQWRGLAAKPEGHRAILAEGA